MSETPQELEKQYDEKFTQSHDKKTFNFSREEHIRLTAIDTTSQLQARMYTKIFEETNGMINTFIDQIVKERLGITNTAGVQALYDLGKGTFTLYIPKEEKKEVPVVEPEVIAAEPTVN